MRATDECGALTGRKAEQTLPLYDFLWSWYLSGHRYSLLHFFFLNVRRPWWCLILSDEFANYNTFKLAKHINLYDPALRLSPMVVYFNV